MKRRILSALLAVIMLLTLVFAVACKDDELPDDSDTNEVTPGPGGSNDTETEEPETTDAETDASGLPSEYFSDYVSDPDAKFVGMTALGATGTAVVYDNYKVLSGQNKEMYANDFEGEDPIALFEKMTAVGGDWNGADGDWVVADQEVAEGEDPNKVLTFTGSAKGAMLAFGNNKWGPYRLNVKVGVNDSDSSAQIYFCVTDEKNYYYLNIDAADGGSLCVYQVSAGNEKIASQRLDYAITYGTLCPVSINIGRNEVAVYFDGEEFFRLRTSNEDLAVPLGKLGFSQWKTQVYIDDVVITDIATGNVIYQNDFEDPNALSVATYGIRNGGVWSNPDNSNGDWVITKEQTQDGTEVDNNVLYFGGSLNDYGATVLFDPEIPEDCDGYKITYRAMRLTGADSSEGYPVVYGWDSEADYYCFNLGGWGGCAAFQTIIGGSKINSPATPEQIGMQNYVWQIVEVYVYPDVCYGFYEGRFLQALWID